MSPVSPVAAMRLRLGLATALGLLAPGALACTVTTAGISFGAYDPFSAAPLDAAGTLTVDCASAFTLTLSPGTGSYASRTLGSSAHILNYNLYTDSAHTQVWGDGSSGTSSVGGSGSATAVDYPVYGRIPAHQNVGAGSYGDSIVVTISF